MDCELIACHNIWYNSNSDDILSQNTSQFGISMYKSEQIRGEWIIELEISRERRTASRSSRRILKSKLVWYYWAFEESADIFVRFQGPNPTAPNCSAQSGPRFGQLVNSDAPMFRGLILWYPLTAHRHLGRKLILITQDGECIDGHLQTLAIIIQSDSYKIKIGLRQNKRLGSVFYSASYWIVCNQ